MNNASFIRGGAVTAYDPFDPVVAIDPYPTYGWLRDEAPLHHSAVTDTYVLSRYDDVWWALNDAALFSSDAMRGVLLGQPTGVGEERLPARRRAGTSSPSTRPGTPSCAASSTAASPRARSTGGGRASTSSSPNYSPARPATGWTSSGCSRRRCPSWSSPNCSAPTPHDRPTSGPGPMRRPVPPAVPAGAASTRRR